jgi:kinesin family member 18/19
MPVATRSRATPAPRGGDGVGAMDWGSASAAPAPGHDDGARREGMASHNHHHGLKEKMRALTLLYERHKQQLSASQGGAAARQHRRSVRRLDAGEVMANDENAAEEDSEGAKRHHDAFAALAPEAAVLRENVAPPQAQAPSKNSHVVAFVPPMQLQEKENVVLRVGNVMSCPIKKAAPAIPVLPMIPAPQARKLSLGCAVGGKLKAARDAMAGNAEASESRILVFVRLRPMSRKEKEAGSRSSVKIVNKKEVYLTEFASENDYLRLKRVRGRHFCFDSAFPDSTTQAEVYSTS